MNEQMQQALIKIIEKANSGVDASINFLGDQLPDVVHQLLTWGLLSSVVACFVCVFVVIAGVITLKKTFSAIESAKDKKQTNWAYYIYSSGVTGSTEGGAVISILLSIILSGISIIVFIANIFDALKIVFAPKIWLIEYAATLAK